MTLIWREESDGEQTLIDETTGEILGGVYPLDDAHKDGDWGAFTYANGEQTNVTFFTSQANAEAHLMRWFDPLDEVQ